MDLLAEQPVGVPELHCSSSCRLDSPETRVSVWLCGHRQQVSR